MPPELHREQVGQLLRKPTEAAACRLETERGPQGHGRLAHARPKCSLYEKRAEGTGESRVLRPTRAPRRGKEPGRWAEALFAETAPHALRKEPRSRRVLAGLRPERQPFPGGASVPAASGYPPGRRPPRKPGGHAGRAQRSGLTGMSDAASQQPALEDPAASHARTRA